MSSAARSRSPRARDYGRKGAVALDESEDSGAGPGPFEDLAFSSDRTSYWSTVVIRLDDDVTIVLDIDTGAASHGSEAAVGMAVSMGRAIAGKRPTITV